MSSARKSKGPNRQKPAIDYELIRGLAQLLEETGLTEIEIEHDGEQCSRRGECRTCNTAPVNTDRLAC